MISFATVVHLRKNEPGRIIKYFLSSADNYLSHLTGSEYKIPLTRTMRPLLGCHCFHCT